MKSEPTRKKIEVKKKHPIQTSSSSSVKDQINDLTTRTEGFPSASNQLKQATEAVAREAGKQQETAFKAKAHIADRVFNFTSQSQENLKDRESLKDAYAHAEKVHSKETDTTERMNENNNKTWVKLAQIAATAALGLASIAVLAKSKK